MDRYQVTVSMVLIGSKDTGAKPSCTREDALKAIGEMVAARLEGPKDFSTGSAGFFASGKVTV